MKLDLILSLTGGILFGLLVYLVYRYANGNWKVVESKQEAYEEWVDARGAMIRRSIRRLGLVFAILMMAQIIKLLTS